MMRDRASQAQQIVTERRLGSSFHLLMWYKRFLSPRSAAVPKVVGDSAHDPADDEREEQRVRRSCRVGLAPGKPCQKIREGHTDHDNGEH